MKLAVIVITFIAIIGSVASQLAREHWVCAWGGAPQLTESRNLPPPPGLADTTLRQTIRLSIGGKALRFRFSNAFGNAPLTIKAAHMAQEGGAGTIKVGTDVELTFSNRPTITIPLGGAISSDSVPVNVAGLADIVVSIYVQDATTAITGHPGARCTSYLARGNQVSSVRLVDAVPVQHWYYLYDVDVVTEPKARSVVVIGDSITDGRGSTTDANCRWPDFLARRLQGHSVAVVNQGIGGNRVLTNELGPSVMARFDRDVLAVAGVRYAIIFEGINDIGTKTGSSGPDPKCEHVADDLIAAFNDLIQRAHARNILCCGATITPCGDSTYFSPELEAARQKVNQWIRRSGKFDAVIDFDAKVRDSKNPLRLMATADCGDHLHLSDAGYEMLSNAVDLNLFNK